MSTTQQLLNDVASGAVTVVEAEEILSTARQRVPYYKRTPFFRTTRNGAVAVYNIMPKPIVLYADQWERLFPLIGEYQKFANDNDEKIKRIG